MHVNATTREMHGNVGFLPWHRAYVLDLERALQSFDPTVAVPYWRFDQPAPNLFTADFMGASTLQNPAVAFTPGHALEQWLRMGSWGSRADPNSASTTRPMSSTKYRPSDLATTMPGFPTWKEILTATPIPASRVKARSVPLVRPCAIRCSSCCMPMSTGCGPSGSGQASRADLRNPDSAPARQTERAPSRRHDVALERRYRNPRPSTAPGGPFPPTAATPAPGQTPKVGDMLDHLAIIGGDPLGYAYDDVPFELPPTVVAGGP